MTPFGRTLFFGLQKVGERARASAQGIKERGAKVFGARGREAANGISSEQECRHLGEVKLYQRKRPRGPGCAQGEGGESNYLPWLNGESDTSKKGRERHQDLPKGGMTSMSRMESRALNS